MFVFQLPEIGEGVVEGEIVQWLVNPGDAVTRDQPLCEIMTDKATIEISSPVGGKVARLHGEPGDIIAVHTPLVDIDDGSAGVAVGEAPPDNGAPVPSPKGAAPAPAPAPKAAPPAPAPTAAPPAPKGPSPAPAPRAAGEKTLASPAVRSYARDHDLDIDSVAGSGKAGRVTRADIDAVAAGGLRPEPTALPAIEAPAWAGVGTRADETIKIIGLRRKIAEKMVESYSNKPHFTYVDEVDVTELVATRSALKKLAADRGVKLTYIPFIMKALCQVFREFPAVNSVLDEATMTMTIRGEINLGIATDTPQGLYVPVVKNCEQKSILELAAEVADVTERTRQGKARMEDFQGGTFTITSVGNIGGRFATPIINAPECAILGVNQIHDRPMVVDGQVVPRKMMYLSPAFDHRVLDGAVAARFTSALKAILENPSSLLLELR